MARPRRHTSQPLTTSHNLSQSRQAPPEFSNSVGMPMAEGLTLANAMLIGGGLRDKVKLIAAGKVRLDIVSLIFIHT